MVTIHNCIDKYVQDITQQRLHKNNLQSQHIQNKDYTNTSSCSNEPTTTSFIFEHSHVQLVVFSLFLLDLASDWTFLPPSIMDSFDITAISSNLIELFKFGSFVLHCVGF